jgi:hypothetical protein
MRNLRLVLAPTSCTLIFSSLTRSRLELSNDRRPRPKKYRHDINMKLVDESRIQELLGYPDAAYHLNCLIAGGSFCLGDC